MKLSLVIPLVVAMLMGCKQTEGPAPIEGHAAVPPGYMLIQLMPIPVGVTSFAIRSESGNIQCGLFELNGEPIVTDVDPCMLAVNMEGDGDIYLAVKNDGLITAQVTVVIH